MRTTWPIHRNRILASDASMLMLSALLRTSVFGILSNQRMDSSDRRHLAWKASKALMCRWYRVQHSLPYKRILRTVAVYTLILVFGCIPRTFQRRWRRSPKLEEALCSLDRISSSSCALSFKTEPRYENFLICLISWSSIVICSCWVDNRVGGW